MRPHLPREVIDSVLESITGDGTSDQREPPYGEYYRADGVDASEAF